MEDATLQTTGHPADNQEFPRKRPQASSQGVLRLGMEGIPAEARLSGKLRRDLEISEHDTRQRVIIYRSRE